MSSFKHHRNNNHRYNIYESHIEVVEQKSFYVVLRNTLFFIALVLSLLVTSLISFDTYKKDKDSHSLLKNQVQRGQLNNEITTLKITQAISNSIIHKIDTNNSFENINQQQLKRIIKNVMEKVKNSPNQVIYTLK